MNPMDKRFPVIPPRSEKAWGKQRQANTTLEPVQERGVFNLDEEFPRRASTELPYRQNSAPQPAGPPLQFYTPPQAPPPHLPAPAMPQCSTDYSIRMRPKTPTHPEPDPKDPSFFKLPPVRNRTISAPLQPRVTDMRVHVEKNAQQAKPTFDVNIEFQFTLEPGSLQ